jgi:hypothetical protein
MKSQPTPQVTTADVERIVRRDYPISLFDVVIGVLGGYGAETWERESFRVQAAALKLANGNLDDLQRRIAAAKQDYRDVLVAAEYPEYWRMTSSGRKMAGIERDRIIDSDWKQYEAWLNR